MFPETVVEPLRLHLEKVRDLHRCDLDEGFGDVYLPYALERELLRHSDVKTTQIYTHVLNRGQHGIKSPLDENQLWPKWLGSTLRSRDWAPAISRLRPG